MMKINLLLILLLFGMNTAFAQPGKVRWKRKQVKKAVNVHLFHSTQVVNLQTTETIRKGEFEYEISHRFLQPINTKGAFGGIDGPGQIRMALAYGITNRLMVSLGRSNREDNVDLRIKYLLWQKASRVTPISISAIVGSGWNTEVVNRSTTDSRNIQYYAQLIANTLLFKKVGIGIVPSFLYNSHIYCVDNQNSFTVGSYLQYYLSTMWSVFVEMNNTVTGFRNKYDAIAAGVEIETGGHFFKIFLTNTAALNPSQYLAGADLKFVGSDWRLGFNITRILTF
ncbi:MAG TPA: hypothetical protein ENJ89_02665 [Caldithrix abyssi]|uniref:DUF5777 domain-containing protein n=1 Tax=Caldithrix abyssi TaxID=187145 RepID=A0A7V5PNT0_CALAY|nr:hypothetical protein [Caldithrix abyssi]